MFVNMYHNGSVVIYTRKLVRNANVTGTRIGHDNGGTSTLLIGPHRPINVSFTSCKSDWLIVVNAPKWLQKRMGGGGVLMKAAQKHMV